MFWKAALISVSLLLIKIPNFFLTYDSILFKRERERLSKPAGKVDFVTRLKTLRGIHRDPHVVATMKGNSLEMEFTHSGGFSLMFPLFLQKREMHW